ncbi:hypothetical protein ACTXT7_005558 [Hymenolepis weldensis]
MPKFYYPVSVTELPEFSPPPSTRQLLNPGPLLYLKVNNQICYGIPMMAYHEQLTSGKSLRTQLF